MYKLKVNECGHIVFRLAHFIVVECLRRPISTHKYTLCRMTYGLFLDSNEMWAKIDFSLCWWALRLLLLVHSSVDFDGALMSCPNNEPTHIFDAWLGRSAHMQNTIHFDTRWKVQAIAARSSHTPALKCKSVCMKCVCSHARHSTKCKWRHKTEMQI